MEMDISFGDKKLTINVYIKMDAYDQLLLSEGVYRQLEIITYHQPLYTKAGGGQRVQSAEGLLWGWKQR